MPKMKDRAHKGHIRPLELAKYLKQFRQQDLNQFLRQLFWRQIISASLHPVFINMGKKTLFIAAPFLTAHPEDWHLLSPVSATPSSTHRGSTS